MAEDTIKIDDQYYILATSSRAPERVRVIKQGDSFAVFDSSGAISQAGLGEQGLYLESTRYLNRFKVAVEGRQLQPLRSTVRSDHVLVVELTNPDYLHFQEPLPRDSLHVVLASVLFKGSWYARVTVRNFSLRTIELELTISFSADYADIFEIRGIKRERRGKLLEPKVDGSQVMLAYEGLDQVRRQTRLRFSPAPRDLTATTACQVLHLPPRGLDAFELTATCTADDTASRASIVSFEEPSFALALESSAATFAARATGATLSATNPRVHEWIERSALDLRMMTTETPEGPYPYAGTPWFSTVFGRDGIITAFEMLWLDPDLARGVLRYLAATQSTSYDPERDAEPGKIIHEIRHGEMATLREIPFGSYYGSVDATPLFVALAGAYWRRTNDRAFVESLWANIERALAWIDNDGDLDRDGFVEYRRRTSKGLVSQGWKDSNDSVSHCDGTLAEGPIALCEVQGYVYAARRAGAVLARVLGHDERAQHLDKQADELHERFERTFWSDELGTYYLALDGAKRPCAVRASNAGHTLFSGIASKQHASHVARSLMSDQSFSGWGIRTLDEREVRYNPLSYHNGSVWPHDNAIAAFGMAHYGHRRRVLNVFSAMYRASVHFDFHRMPELFCGFTRQEHDGPTPYPVACAPQSWAAGAVFMLIQACLGIDIDATQRRVRLIRPILPENLDRLTITGLRVDGAVADLGVHRQGDHVGVFVERCDGDLEIISVKRDR